jgi:PleD family two-component response regulator
MPDPGTKLDRSSIRILIIDDDLEFAGLIRMHLTAAGYAAEVAEDAIEGGKALLERPPALILCDISMPFMNGLELVSLMQADEKSASIPVVFISGRSDSNIMARAVELGAADFLMKPVTREQLLQTVETCLQAGGRKAALPNYGFPPVV